MKPLEDLAREAGIRFAMKLSDPPIPYVEATPASLARFHSLCRAEVMEEAAQIAEDSRGKPSPYQGELEYRADEKAYETAQRIAAAIREAAKEQR